VAFPDPATSAADATGPFVCETPNGPVALNSLTLEQLEVIEDRVNLPWMVVIAAPPANRAKIARVVYEVCCESTGATPETITVQQILDGELFHQIESDMPDFDDSRDVSESSGGTLDIDPKALDPGTDG